MAFKFSRGEGFKGPGSKLFVQGESAGVFQVQVSQSITTSWYDGVYKQLQTSWLDGSIVAKQITTSWYVQVGQQIQTSWYDQLYKQLQTSWYDQLYKQIQTSWYDQVGQQIQTSWFVGTVVDKQITTSWYDQVYKQIQTSWNYEGFVTKQLPTSWLVNGRINMAFGLQAYSFPRYRVPNNVNYRKVRILTVQNTDTSLLTGGSSLDLVIDHASMVAAGEVDEYGDQFRMTYTDGQNPERELDLDIINPNTSTTTLRFPLQASIPTLNQVSTYNLYSDVADKGFFEETFRDKKNVYYFWANQLSSNLAQTNGTWSNSKTGIQRIDDGTTAKLGFNVPGNADVEIDFRFLDSGATDQSKYIGIEWRGDGNVSRTFRLDNDSSSGNRIVHYFDGSSWNSLTPIPNIQLKEATMRVSVQGSTVKMYVNGTLLATVTDSTTPTGGMRIVLPSGSESNISALRVKWFTGTYALTLAGSLQNLVNLTSDLKLLMKGGILQNVQSTVLRLKKQNDNMYTLESFESVGELGDNIPATVGQKDSLEIKLWNSNHRTFANIMRYDT